MDVAHLADFYDAELCRFDVHLRAAAHIGPGDRVLDIGCGAGGPTREAARAAPAGSATGVDVSAAMLDRARQLARAEGLHNVTFELGDAQSHRFPPAGFDLCISRFGTMFFADPVAAFANIRTAMRHRARLVMLVWREARDNEWFTAVREALTGGVPRAPTPREEQPFSLADPGRTSEILAAAGFDVVEFTPVHEPVHYGPDPGAAFDAVLRLQHARDLLSSLEPPAARRAAERLRAKLQAHSSDDGVIFDAQAWIITAHRR